MKTIYRSDRRFTLVSYHTSHGPLLWRSGKTPEHSTRCEVLFMDVRAMELRVWSDGLTIAEEDIGYLSQFPSFSPDLLEPGLVAYSIGNEVWRGFVLGGKVFTAEDEGDFFDPSPLVDA